MGYASALTVTDSTFTNNSSAGYGGGLAWYWYNLGTGTTVTGCTFTGNHATTSGGAASLLHKNHTWDRCWFEDNYAGSADTGATCATSITSGNGGAVYVAGYNTTNLATVTLRNSIFWDNRAYYGGAIVQGGYANLDLINCSTYSNCAYQAGGALYIGSTTSVDTDILNTILMGDSAPSSPETTSDATTTIDCSYYGTAAGWTTPVTNVCNLDGSGLDNYNTTHDATVYTTPASGDFSPQVAVSPWSASVTVDAAYGTTATSYDYYGNGRNDTEEVDVGSGTPTYVDMGAIEY
jgi:hypothetical protein